MTAAQEEIIRLTAEFIGYFYTIPTSLNDKLPLTDMPDYAHRKHPMVSVLEQVLSGYILDDILKPLVPDNAMGYVAFVALDLWPGENWNFVFGQASYEDRVGVWSIFRFGEPDKGAISFRHCLLLTLKIAVHEIGHMFSMHHCIAHECVMNGINHLDELDRQTLELCPECTAKIIWATKSDVVNRYKLLEQFCQRNGLIEEAAAYQVLLRATQDDLEIVNNRDKKILRLEK